MTKYICTYYQGNGRPVDGGTWIKKETEKTIIFVCIEPSFFAIDWDKLVYYKNTSKRNKHCFKDWEDGSYTVYPMQSGVPHVFEPITKI